MTVREPETRLCLLPRRLTRRQQSRHSEDRKRRPHQLRTCERSRTTARHEAPPNHSGPHHLPHEAFRRPAPKGGREKAPQRRRTTAAHTTYPRSVSGQRRKVVREKAPQRRRTTGTSAGEQHHSCGGTELHQPLEPDSEALGATRSEARAQASEVDELAPQAELARRER